MTALTPTAGAWDGLDFLYPVRVFYEDTDFSGFVYHASYVRFFERGRSEALRSLGVSHNDLLKVDPPAGMVVRRLLVDYYLPCRMDDIVVIRTKFRSARGARMVISQVMERDTAAVATAELEVALINLDGRPRKLTAELVAKLGPRLQTP